MIASCMKTLSLPLQLKMLPLSGLNARQLFNMTIILCSDCIRVGVGLILFLQSTDSTEQYAVAKSLISMIRKCHWYGFNELGVRHYVGIHIAAIDPRSLQFKPKANSSWLTIPDLYCHIGYCCWSLHLLYFFKTKLVNVFLYTDDNKVCETTANKK